MGLSSKERRALIARGHRLETKVNVSVSGDAPTESVVKHLRTCLTERDLIKIRIRADDRAACDAEAAALAARVPCEVVSRVGRVVLLYRPNNDP